MNILMVTWEYPPLVVGGLSAHVQGLSRALVEKGCQVTVITQEAATPREYEDKGVKVIRVGPIPISSKNFMSYVHQLNHLILSEVIKLVAGGQAFELIHAHDWIVAFAAAAIKQALCLPLVATIHATEYGRNNGLHTDEQRHISDIEWWLIYEAWKVIVCSSAMNQELQYIFQVPQDKIRVIPNGIDIKGMQIVPDQAFRRQYAADYEEIVLFIGRLVFEKGVDTLLLAYNQMLAVRPNVKLIIAGKGPIQGDLESLAQQLGVSHKVVFAGHVDAARRNKLLSIANVAVFPSRYEPFGIVALEAMAAGVPVIVGNAGGLKEIVTDQQDGFLVEPGSAGALSTAILTMLDDKKRASTMAEKAKQKVIDKYSWNSVAESTHKLYSQVLEEHANSDWAKQSIWLNKTPYRFEQGRYQLSSSKPISEASSIQNRGY
jgi:glycogen(starch) synthase